MLYSGLKGAGSSILTNDLVPQNRRIRNHHSLAFQTPLAGTDIFKSSLSPQTSIRDWNSLTNSLISASRCAEDSVTKFTSVTDRFGPIPVRTPGRVGLIPVRSGRFDPGRLGPISGVGLGLPVSPYIFL